MNKMLIEKNMLTSVHLWYRYWARNYMGHTSFASKVPNIGHRALVKMEQQGKVCYTPDTPLTHP